MRAAGPSANQRGRGCGRAPKRQEWQQSVSDFASESRPAGAEFATANDPSADACLMESRVPAREVAWMAFDF